MTIDSVALAGKRARGKRPYYFEHPDTDRLLSVLMAVAGELAVARERIDTLERLLEQQGVLSREAVERYAPDPEAAEQRGQWHREYIARILRIVQQEREAIEEQQRGQPSPDLAEVSAELGKV
jgi:hypothetical protein